MVSDLIPLNSGIPILIPSRADSADAKILPLALGMIMGERTETDPSL
jgi:hypothetical protein